MKASSSLVIATGVVGLMALVGCSGPPEQSDGIDQTSEAVTSGAILGPYIWNQGPPGQVQPGKVLISTATGFCYFTRISGGFRGGGERVSLGVSGGNWVLAGQSGQSGVGAQVACVPWTALGVSSGTVWLSGFQFGNFSVGASQNPQYCYLAGFGGETNGGGESVSVYPSGSGYMMEIDHLSGAGMTGQMACITTSTPFKLGPSPDVRQTVTSLCVGSQGCNAQLAIPLGNQAGYCMLNRLAGRLRGGAEYAEIDQNGSQQNWIGKIGSQQGGNGANVSTTIRCNYF